MKTYELTYILSTQISAEDAQAESSRISGILQSDGGVILKAENPVAKTLAYPIKKEGSGFFSTIEFQAEPEKLSEIENKLKKDGKLLRYLLVIKEAGKIKKERRRPIRAESTPEAQPAAPAAEKPAEEQPKVELKDIEQKLDEILGQ